MIPWFGKGLSKRKSVLRLGGDTLYTVDIAIVSDLLPGYALFNNHH